MYEEQLKVQHFKHKLQQKKYKRYLANNSISSK